MTSINEICFSCFSYTLTIRVNAFVNALLFFTDFQCLMRSTTVTKYSAKVSQTYFCSFSLKKLRCQRRSISGCRLSLKYFCVRRLLITMRYYISSENGGKRSAQSLMVRPTTPFALCCNQGGAPWEEVVQQQHNNSTKNGFINKIRHVLPCYGINHLFRKQPLTLVSNFLEQAQESTVTNT